MEKERFVIGLEDNYVPNGCIKEYEAPGRGSNASIEAFLNVIRASTLVIPGEGMARES